MRLDFRVRILTAISVLIALSSACGGPNEPTTLAALSVSPDFALTYQSTTTVIHGTGFDRPSVTLGGRTARVRSANDSTIWVETPLSDAGVVDVVVTNYSGEQARIAKGFTFRDFGPTGIEAADGVFAAKLLTVHGAGFLAGAR